MCSSASSSPFIILLSLKMLCLHRWSTLSVLLCYSIVLFRLLLFLLTSYLLVMFIVDDVIVERAIFLIKTRSFDLVVRRRHSSS
jgi:hypothetical protein